MVSALTRVSLLNRSLQPGLHLYLTSLRCIPLDETFLIFYLRANHRNPYFLLLCSGYSSLYLVSQGGYLPSIMASPDFDDSHRHCHVQLLCEVHRYGVDIGYKTDSVTVHGLDEGDRYALISACGHKVNRRMARGLTPSTLVFNDVEHINILNVLTIERGFGVQSEPKMLVIPNAPGTSDLRYVVIYHVTKRRCQGDRRFL